MGEWGSRSDPDGLAIAARDDRMCDDGGAPFEGLEILSDVRTTSATITGRLSSSTRTSRLHECPPVADNDCKDRPTSWSVIHSGPPVGGFAQLEDGSLLLFRADDICRFYRDGALETVVNHIAVPGMRRFNDALADPENASSPAPSVLLLDGHQRRDHLRV